MLFPPQKIYVYKMIAALNKYMSVSYTFTEQYKLLTDHIEKMAEE